ncbi:MAG: S8 family serine peptidase [Solirubrobacteraceae bacterium]
MGLLFPAAVHAEATAPAQAIADSGAFLPYAPPPPQLGGLCLVDTGVNANPDTEGVVVERTAIDGGSGNDVSPTMHGTVLAMMAGAPVNGWGMVGTAPRSIQIVSVRILEPGQTTFPFSSYADGITACLRVRQKYNVRVINLSLGGPETQSSQENESLSNAIERATNYGVAVVAAAGNDNGGPVEYPAAYSSVLSVGATDSQGGAFCPFSNRGEGLRLLAPGCDLDGADPTSGAPDYDYWQGTSESSAIAAAALDALESYQPSLTPEAAEQDLTGADNGVLDIAQAFRNAGLGAIVAAGEAAAPGAQPVGASSPVIPPQGMTPSSAMPLIGPFQRPRARLKRLKGHFVLVISSRPDEAQAQVRYLGHRARSRHLSVLRTLHGAFSNLTLPPSGVVEVSVRYTDPYDIRRASPWITLRLPSPTAKTSKGRHSR